MKIYISHSSNFDYERKLYEPLKASALAKKHIFFLPHEPSNLDVAAEEVFKDTDLLVAETSFPSTGQGIELGLAIAAGVPVVCFYKSDTKPSSSLRFVTTRIIAYTDTNDFLTKLESALTT